MNFNVRQPASELDLFVFHIDFYFCFKLANSISFVLISSIHAVSYTSNYNYSVASYANLGDYSHVNTVLNSSVRSKKILTTNPS